MLSDKQLRRIVGKHGEKPPQGCAVSGKALISGYQTRTIGAFYYAVNAGETLTDDVKNQIEKYIAAQSAPQKSVKVEAKKDGE